MKNKWTKKDFIYLGLLLCSMVLVVFFILRNKYLLGSTVDWESQHIYLPEYFRTLFYQTKDIFPDFAFHIGSGQNIYNFAYYGLLNPIILLSYFMPHVSMMNYVMASTFLLVFASVCLFYLFLRHHEENEIICFFCSFLFLSATPLLFHLHRHIMFINYMPFLVLGLWGVDKYFEKKKGWLLTLSVFLMLLMSFYFAVGGIITLVIYGIYVYCKQNTHITVGSFFKDGFRFLLPIILGILCACILIVPTFYVILSGRGATTVSIGWKDILLPKINLDYVLYRSYSIGLTCIIIPAIIHLLFQKEKHQFFLGVILSCFVIFPLGNYLLNATMYLDPKAFIPLLPLFVFAIYILIKDLFAGKVNMKVVLPISIMIGALGCGTLGSYKVWVLVDLLITTLLIWFYSWKKKKWIMMIPIMVIAVGVSYGISINDEMPVKENLEGKSFTDQKELIQKITDADQSFYRISNQITPVLNTNRTFENIKYYHSTLYSSTYNKAYNNFYYDTMNNAVQSRNRVITSAPKNPLFLMLTGNKYIIDTDKRMLGYNKKEELDGYQVYQSVAVFPIGYASSHLMSEEEFHSLQYPMNQDALLKNIIVDRDVASNFISKVEKIDLGLQESDFQELDVTKENGIYQFKVSKKKKLSVPLKEKMTGKYLWIRFDILESMPCKVGDLNIVLNGINNKLTCSEWKYHNKNYTFDYVLATDEIDSLDFTFYKGSYKIKNIETYVLNYDDIKDARNNIDEFMIDKDKTKGDKIIGDITVKEDGYFTLTIPYDQGFTFLVDGKKVDYEKVNTAFIGIPITKGDHHIEVTFHSPWKNIGMMLSLIGIVGFALEMYIERKKSK